MGGLCSSANRDDVTDTKNLQLTPNDLQLIQNSWKHVVQTGLKEYGVRMMLKIFIEHKELKPLWRFSRGLETPEQITGSALLQAHGEKLFTALDMAINMLNDMNALVPILIQLGHSHYKFGVRNHHFSYIGQALLDTLADGLKAEFNEKTKTAWIKLFAVVEAQMKIGMAQAAEQEGGEGGGAAASASKSNQVNAQ